MEAFPPSDVPPADVPPVAGPVGSHWTQNRVKLLTWFRRNAPSLGELYEGAVNMVFGKPLPGRTRFVAHAVRDIRNLLPEKIAGKKGGSRFEWKQQLDGLTRNWQKAGFSLVGSIPINMSQGGNFSESRPTEVNVPNDLILRIAGVLNEHSRTSETRREAATRLFEACSPGNKRGRESLKPIVDQWMDITEWFVERVHDSGLADGDHDWDEFTRHFVLFEDTLTSLLGEFFTTIEGLDDILDDANA